MAAISLWLEQSVAPGSWTPFTKPATPTYRGRVIRDCRAADTGSAAEAAAAAARFVETGDPLDVTYAIAAADCAFDESPLGNDDHFREWLLTIALPAAFAGRALSSGEQEALRDYDAADVSRLREQRTPHKGSGLLHRLVNRFVPQRYRNP